MNKYVERLYNGVIKENPTFVLMLGMCPTLAVTSSAPRGRGPAGEGAGHREPGQPHGSLYYLPPAHRPVPHGGGVRDAPGLSGGARLPSAGSEPTAHRPGAHPHVRPVLSGGGVYPVGGAGGHYDRSAPACAPFPPGAGRLHRAGDGARSEEHTSELQSQR